MKVSWGPILNAADIHPKVRICFSHIYVPSALNSCLTYLEDTIILQLQYNFFFYIEINILNFMIKILLSKSAIVLGSFSGEAVIFTLAFPQGKAKVLILPQWFIHSFTSNWTGSNKAITSLSHTKSWSRKSRKSKKSSKSRKSRKVGK